MRLWLIEIERESPRDTSSSFRLSALAFRGNDMSRAFQVREVSTLGEREIQGLCDVLIDCVEGGASVSFMWPMTHEKAETFWRKVAASTERGERIVLVAEDSEGIIGTVQVILDLPENQPHRADVAKMLVHQRARRLGVGAALLAAAEQSAFNAGRNLLVLDTVTGTDAARLYSRQGWQRVGEIPNYALWPDGRLCPTTVFYKSLALVVQ
jgi:GNAT superfamily N-acetyltransferase